MKIDEAIENITIFLNDPAGIESDDFEDSIKLSREALRVVKKYHDYFIREGVVPLPEETLD